MPLSLLLAALASVSAHPQLRTGDIVLHTSRSQQSAAIRIATDSRYSHVGIVEVTRKGVFVIEAIQPVSRAPWSAWRARGDNGDVTVLRHPGLDEPAARRVIAAARQFLGRPYDWTFGWGDEAIYCSELVHKAYLRGARLEVGRLQRLDSLRLGLVQAAARERYGGSIPAALEVVTPASIAEDPALVRVFSTYD